MAASVFNIFNVTMNNIVTSEGAAKMTMYVLMTGAGLNVLLDPILIYSFHMGIAGAALATAFAQMISSIISMGSLMVFGFIKGFQPIAGYSYGAKLYDRLKEAIKTSVIWSTCFCTVYGIVMAICAPVIIASFTKGDSQMIQVGTEALRANGVSFVLFGFSTVYSSLFLSLGKARTGFILGILRQGICFIPLIMILPMLFGIKGILYAQPISDVISAIITVFSAILFYRELANEKQEVITIKV